jgi:acyl-CoA reductase-like NAD-dependent aldehyde dehydrogenase
MTRVLAQMLVEGKLLDSASDASLDVVNPSNGQKLGGIPVGCNEDVNKAVSSTRRAFDDGRWSDAPPSVKRRTLSRLAEGTRPAGCRRDG